MSNHSGSYMLNAVLELLEQEQVFAMLGKEKTVHLIQKIIGLSFEYDCNPGEILENIGERFGICYCCTKTASELKDGLCEKCHFE